jgi:Tat protein secretion system quality control protein TatD with DNase activity
MKTITHELDLGDVGMVTFSFSEPVTEEEARNALVEVLEQWKDTGGIFHSFSIKNSEIEMFVEEVPL